MSSLPSLQDPCACCRTLLQNAHQVSPHTPLCVLQDFASKCHISHLVDKRFQGMAVGVGQSKIIGKVHQVWVWVACVRCDWAPVTFMVTLVQLSLECSSTLKKPRCYEASYTVCYEKHHGEGDISQLHDALQSGSFTLLCVLCQLMHACAAC